MTIGSEIRKGRLKKKLTQDELSRMTGISRPYISDIEHDRYSPSVSTLILICNALKMDFNFLKKVGNNIHDES